MSVTDGTVMRLLVIDDSVRVRRIVTRALAREPGVEVVAAMRNGRAAITRSERLAPDVVLLDSEVAIDGDCPTLHELRRLDPTLRVVMRGESHLIDEERVRQWVLPAIRGRTPRAVAPRAVPVTPESPEGSGAATTERAARVRAVAIAASTGGPDALEEVLSALPEGLPVPVFVVQHMPPDFTRMLAERLDRRTRLSVAEAVAGAAVCDGHVYVAPGGRHLALERSAEGARIVTHDGPRENSCRPAADVLFRSAAGLYGAGLLAVVLTGMGQDGLAGAAAVRHGGGRVIVQSEDSAVIASMPGAVARHGLADAIYDLGDIGSRVVALARGGEAW